MEASAQKIFNGAQKILLVLGKNQNGLGSIDYSQLVAIDRRLITRHNIRIVREAHQENSVVIVRLEIWRRRWFVDMERVFEAQINYEANNVSKEGTTLYKPGAWEKPFNVLLCKALEFKILKTAQ